MIHDDPTLLDSLFHDMESSSELWKPTNYWEVEEKFLMPTIRREGIAHFRSSYNSAFITFGVTSVPQILTRAFVPKNTTRKIFLKVLRMLGLDELVFKGHIEEHARTFAAFQNTCFQLVLQCDPDKEILTIADSGLANPRDLFSPEGHKEREYTISFLRYFWQYLWLKRFIDFKRIKMIMELGSGYGGQAEVLCKLHPHIKYIICDIPPQVYIAEQYLKSCFPGEVMSYSQTAGQNSIDITQLRSKRIMVLAPWQIERIVGKVDLFWNSASFQEMEPNIVRNYVRLIQPLTSKYAYLLQLPAGQSIAREKGERYGVLTQTTLEHYIKFFDEFELIQQEDAFIFTGIRYLFCSGYSNMLFHRREHRVPCV
jgi:putative sugar O-methyltransferase